jgi:hypothetical protein
VRVVAVPAALQPPTDGLRDAVPLFIRPGTVVGMGFSPAARL